MFSDLSSNDLRLSRAVLNPKADTYELELIFLFPSKKPHGDMQTKTPHKMNLHQIYSRNEIQSVDSLPSSSASSPSSGLRRCSRRVDLRDPIFADRRKTTRLPSESGINDAHSKSSYQIW
ncbi:unnamed protein product [Phytophthora fragariaefolia]|uniref:Unnamed protein product n=1 Tax=Phytophthora fragariaefolia TaxID=1490495 RepID=A0A9W7D1T7_9STRA|nr:unnamed protein product [Phytophthora fragariaefolia]